MLELSHVQPYLVCAVINISQWHGEYRSSSSLVLQMWNSCIHTCPVLWSPMLLWTSIVPVISPLVMHLGLSSLSHISAWVLCSYAMYRPWLMLYFAISCSVRLRMLFAGAHQLTKSIIFICLQMSKVTTHVQNDTYISHHSQITLKFEGSICCYRMFVCYLSSIGQKYHKFSTWRVKTWKYAFVRLQRHLQFMRSPWQRQVRAGACFKPIKFYLCLI